jgi:hypothetical protein
MPTIEPGQMFYDKLPDGRYERCVLQPTTVGTPDRKAAARGGTGEFYKAIPIDGLTKQRMKTAEIIFDADLGRMVFLERDPPV